MKRSRTVIPLASAMLLLIAASAYAQPQLPQPEPSPKSSLTQAIGISEVQVSYHRPAVKGRQIWGALVPYGEVWRAGANENTTISLSHQVKIEGKLLPAGTYGLHMIPTQGEWTIIFSKNATSWGSYFYKESEDAIRCTVKPQSSQFQEWLVYEFAELTDSSALLTLSWEKLRVPISMTFDTPALVYAEARDSYLRGPAGFTWQGFNQAAQYCVRKNMNLDQALVWVDRSIGINENFGNLRTKASILDKLGKTSEATALREISMKLATEADLNNLGYTLMNGGKVKEAIEIFQKNAKLYPDSWNVYDSLAEALEKSGDAKGAINNYEKAFSLVRDEANRKRLSDTLAKLKAQK